MALEVYRLNLLTELMNHFAPGTCTVLLVCRGDGFQSQGKRG